MTNTNITPYESNQQAFDLVCEHLAQQTEPAYDSEAITCKYRTSDGLKCAVGALIPDELYDPKFDCHPERGDSITVFSLLKEQNMKELFKNVDTPILSRLQDAHDNVKDLEHLRTRLFSIAKDYNLKIEKIDLITEWKGITSTDA